MAVLDKLKFWKREEPFSVPAAPDIGRYGEEGLGQGTGEIGSFGAQDFLKQQTYGMPSYDTGLGNIGTQQTGFGATPEPTEFQGNVSQPSAFSKLSQVRPQQMQQAPDIYTLSKNIEIISSKMDTIKAVLEHLAEKIEKIEKIAEGEEETSKRYRRY